MDGCKEAIRKRGMMNNVLREHYRELVDRYKHLSVSMHNAEEEYKDCASMRREVYEAMKQEAHAHMGGHTIDDVNNFINIFRLDKDE
jgi:hypothetical protein